MRSVQKAYFVAWVLGCGLLQACSDSSTQTGLGDDTDSGVTTRLKSFASDQEMLKQFRQAARVESEQANDFFVAETDAQATDSLAVGGSAPAATSTTNVQVQGVDEADLIKVSGDQLYALQAPAYDYGIAADSAVFDPSYPQKPTVLKRFQLSEPAVLLDEAVLPAETTWSGLYHLDSRQQLVLQGEGSGPSYGDSTRSYWWDGGAVSLRGVGVGAGDALTDAAWDLEFDGQLVGSRRIGNTLYLVTEYGAPYIHPYASELGNIDKLSLSDWLPSWRFNGGDQGVLVSARDCYPSSVDARRQSTRVTALIALPLDNPSQLETRCLMGTAETLFVSQDALYVATTESYYGGWSGGATDLFFPASTETDVHKFSFDGVLSYRGGVRLSGHLGWHPQQRSYRMGERDGVLSVVTSGGSQWMGSNQDHRLYMLEEQAGVLVLKAQLPNSARSQSIGKPGERIYGTRVLADRIYVVTFLTTDPLYVIDISNAADPFVASELEVPGFSDYLHPVGDDLLLGVGKSASSDGVGDEGRGGWYQGLRLSLFDVSDASNPTLVNALEYGDRGSSSDLFSDFHALAWLDKSDRSAEFALPVDLYRYGTAPEYPWQQGGFVHRGLYRFTVDSSGLREHSQALLGSAAGGERNGRSVLSNDGRAWFYDRGELYFSSPSNPALLQPSRQGG